MRSKKFRLRHRVPAAERDSPGLRLTPTAPLCPGPAGVVQQTRPGSRVTPGRHLGSFAAFPDWKIFSFQETPTERAGSFRGSPARAPGEEWCVSRLYTTLGAEEDDAVPAMKLTPNAAMRARDVSRPRAEHLAEAEVAEVRGGREVRGAEVSRKRRAGKPRASGSRPGGNGPRGNGRGDRGGRRGRADGRAGIPAATPGAAGRRTTRPLLPVRRGRSSRWVFSSNPAWSDPVPRRLLVVEARAERGVQRAENLGSVGLLRRDQHPDGSPAGPQQLAILLRHVGLALVQHGQAHHVPGDRDLADLLHFEDPAGGDPGPRADRVEPEVDARRFLLC